MFIVDDFQEPVEIFFIRNNSRQTENTPARVVFVYSHINIALGGDGNNAFEEIGEIVPKLLFAHADISRRNFLKLVPRIARVPAGKRYIRTCFERVGFIDLLLIVNERSRTVGVFMVKLSPRPVKYGHEVIANALDSRLRKPSYILAVIFNVSVSGRKSRLYILVNGNTLYNLEFKSRVLGKFLEPHYALLAPHLADGNVVHGCNN